MCVCVRVVVNYAVVSFALCTSTIVTYHSIWNVCMPFEWLNRHALTVQCNRIPFHRCPLSVSIPFKLQLRALAQNSHKSNVCPIYKIIFSSFISSHFYYVLRLCSFFAVGNFAFVNSRIFRGSHFYFRFGHALSSGSIRYLPMCFNAAVLAVMQLWFRDPDKDTYMWFVSAWKLQ